MEEMLQINVSSSTHLNPHKKERCPQPEIFITLVNSFVTIAGTKLQVPYSNTAIFSQQSFSQQSFSQQFFQHFFNLLKLQQHCTLGVGKLI